VDHTKRPLREAARLLAELAAVKVGSETLRTRAERLGTEFRGQARAATADVETGTSTARSV
jgi:hypothetical protein